LSPHPTSIAEGRIAIVTTREAGCGGRGCADRRAARSRTAKSCGPGAPRLALSFREDTLRVSRWRRWQQSLAHRGEREV